MDHTEFSTVHCSPNPFRFWKQLLLKSIMQSNNYADKEKNTKIIVNEGS